MRIPTIVMCALCFASMATQTLCSTKFTVKELSVPKGAKSAIAVSVNVRGDVVGYSIAAKRSPYGPNITRAVLWKDGKLIDLHPSSSAADSRAVAINDKGDVLVSSGYYNAYLWTNGKFRNLGTLPGYPKTLGYALNNKGQVAGVCFTSNGLQKPFIWTNGRMVLLKTPPKCSWAEIVGISDQGVVIGRTEIYETRSYWVLWKQQKMNILNMPKVMCLFGMNNKSNATGFNEPNRSNRIAVVWQDGNLKQLNIPKGLRGSQGKAINDRGWIAGNAISGRMEHALVWLSNEVVDLRIPGRNTRAYDINNAGTVVGTLADAHGNSRPAVWTMHAGK
ncbi:MAG: hypothetical protein ACYC1M_16235 [Armatimonadota bacterium]